MRKIERKIIAALKDGIATPLSKRDSTTFDRFSGLLEYRLWDHVVFRRNPFGPECALGTMSGCWQTNTTKSRINAIARVFNLPTISQRDFIWTWSDGVPYTGTRIFGLEQRKVAPL